MPVLTAVHFDLWPGYSNWERERCWAEVQITFCNDHLRILCYGCLAKWILHWSGERTWIVCSVCVPASRDVLFRRCEWGASLCWNKPPANGGCRRDGRWRGFSVFVSVCILTSNPILAENTHFWVNYTDPLNRVETCVVPCPVFISHLPPLLLFRLSIYTMRVPAVEVLHFAVALDYELLKQLKTFGHV